jgi:hypothetical protein
MLCFVSGFCLLAHLLVLLLPEPFSLFIGKITQKNPLYLIIYAKKYVLCAEMYKKTNIRIIIMILERFYYMKTLLSRLEIIGPEKARI